MLEGEAWQPEACLLEEVEHFSFRCNLKQPECVSDPVTQKVLFHTVTHTNTEPGGQCYTSI